MSRQDIGNEYQWRSGFAPQDNVTADANGLSCDFQDCGPEVCAVVVVGNVTGGSATTIEFEESADETTWTDIAGVTVAITDSDANTVQAGVNFNRAQRYVRPVVNTTGGSVDLDLAIAMGARKTSF